jgi:hypothetical protein
MTESEMPIESDAPWGDEPDYEPRGPVPYEVTSEPEPEPKEGGWEVSGGGLGGAESASKGLGSSARPRSRATQEKPPELDYGRDNGVGGVPWQKPCGWCGVIHGHTTAQRAVRERHFRYERTAANGGIAPVEKGKHGASTYVNWGCSCDVCNRGNNELAARRLARRRERKAAAEAEGA